jgi:hypothetical protein
VNEPKIYSLEELTDAYPRHWLAVDVVERDHQGQPLKVTILARELDVFSVRRNAGRDNYCTLYTGPIPEVNHLGMY